MAIEITLPFSKKNSVKDLIFTILSYEYPLKLIELTNYIRKRYGKSVTFQAVRKATLELVEQDVLLQTKHSFQINKRWVRESKQMLEKLYTSISEEKTKPLQVDSIAGELSVFTFSSLNELMKFWQELIDNWFHSLEQKKRVMNCYQAAHAWEGLLHLDKERELMGQLKKKGVRSHILSIGNTPLDRNIKKFYASLGVDMQIRPSLSAFDKSYYVGTYGDMIIQTRYPPQLVSALDVFFKKNKNIETFRLQDLSRIVNKKTEMQLTVIKNKEMAEQMNKSILSQMV